MPLMLITLELGRTRDYPDGSPQYGYEFIAPLDRQDHIDAAAWATAKQHCSVRCFRPGQDDRMGFLRHVGHGWRFDYDKGRSDDDEPFFKLDRHVVTPGLYLTLTEEDGVQRPFKIVSVMPAAVTA